MSNLTVILPVNEFNDELKGLYKRAIASIPTEAEVIVVGDKKTLEKYKKETEANYTFLENEETDFVNQVNKAVSECKTEYFSVLEVDDEYTPSFYKNFEIYSKAMPDTFGFMYLNEVYKYTSQEDGPIGYLNEVFWASSFSEVIGYPDEESLLDYISINLTGAIFKKDVFLEVGALKPLIKVSFWYEFILRALHKKKEIFVIPKVGYKHYIEREGSLTSIYKKEMSQDEGLWWINLAQQDYVFTKQKDKKHYIFEK